MMESQGEPDKIKQNIAAYQAAITAGTHTQKDLDDYLSEVHEARTGKPFVNASPDAPEPSGFATKALGAVSSVGRGNPLGVLQTVVRAGYRHQPYSEASAEIEGAQDAAPAAARIPFQVAGAVAEAAVPIGKVGSLVKRIPRGAVADVGTALFPRLARANRVVRAIQKSNAGPIAEAAAPKAEGLQSVIQSVAERQGPTGVTEAITRRPSVIADALKPAKARQAHRTAAQFEHFAQRTGKATPAKSESFDAQLTRQIKKLRAEQPDEIGNVIGDADIAQGAGQVEPDLAQLLRRSIKMVSKSPR